MKILVIGPSGQVGSTLLETLPAIGEVIAAGRRDLDLCKKESIAKALAAARPDVIVNAAAYTAVDQAETEEALAMAVNRDGPALLAEEAARRGALLVHFSTDYVFDGEKPSPYVESDATNPLNAYGRSKLAGEQAIQRSGCRHLIFRTSWVYSHIGRNFLLTMRRLARDKRELRVVDDQHGAPTSSRMLADAVPRAITAVLHDSSLGGLYHMSAQGSTTWCGFARAIVGDHVKVLPISSSEYPTPARRPRNSVLDNSKLEQDFGIRLPSWQSGLNDVLGALAA
ncbi:MAG: dTDP-4-dehydrorhamnose reductase [Betaproteobacteria bacterium RIFCSPLOWO2_12_FULL_65_14]|nr:MAG: dTDP-4-dehydrorhamnose reductase [Betaproteobacteria bacterium RIFCSPLOWO2_12_FULL_65_14]